MTPPLILFEDSHVIVAIKPTGVESQASAGGNDMISALASHTGGDVYPVHRLDRGTEGIMVYAKTSAAAASLSRAFANGETEKRYLAVTVGAPEADKGDLTDLLWHDVRKNKSYVVARKRGGVKEARLSYRVAAKATAEGHELALISVVLHTGRTHQIRVQFASRKTPLLGDTRYGGVKLPAYGGDPALASVSLTFPHPVTKKPISFTYAPNGGVWELFGITPTHSVED